MSAPRRQSLASLVDAVAPAQPATAPAQPATAPAPAAPASQPEPEEAPRRRATKAEAPPRYLQLERKEARIRPGQYDDLTRLARALNRKKPRGQGGAPTERITENTLIRVAIDLLLGRQGRLAGGTEDELRKSVTP